MPMTKILAAVCAAAAGLACAASPYVKSEKVQVPPQYRVFETVWKANALAIPEQASDAVFVRRIYLDLAGRLPTPVEAKAYYFSKDPEKRSKLIDRLVASDDFAENFANRFCDMLRVKSEFPINLWPDAVYVYRRRIVEFLKGGSPRWDEFAKSQILSSGSNFRDPDCNFWRATPIKTPEGLANIAALTFLGRRYDRMSGTDQKNLAEFFSGIKFKSTREWKEEIVYTESAPEERVMTLPDGSKAAVPAGGDPRKAFCSWMLGRGSGEFSAAMANRMWAWIFGRGIVNEPDDFRKDNPPVSSELMNWLAKSFQDSGYDLKALVKLICGSPAYESASFGTYPDIEKANRFFAACPVRRLDAETIDDAICAITETEHSFSSVIPEPFTFLPGNAPANTIADGSITSQFLILFGRPARDSGLVSERLNGITPKQRLFLFNSGDIYRRLQRIPSRKDMRLPLRQRIAEMYWMFYSRPPEPEETAKLVKEFESLKGGQAKWRFYYDLAWILLNSKEFLHQH